MSNENTINTTSNFNRKFSLSKIRDNPRKSVVVIDSRYEFNAPKYYDFKKRKENIEDKENSNNSENDDKISTNKRKSLIENNFKYNEDYIDPWFFIDHRKAAQIAAKSKRNSSSVNNDLNSIGRSQHQNTNNNLDQPNNKYISNKNRNSALQTEITNIDPSEKIYSIDEMIKMHNEKLVRKRKFSVYERDSKRDELMLNKLTGDVNNKKELLKTNYDHTKKKKISHTSKKTSQKEIQIKPLNLLNSNLYKTSKKINNNNLTKTAFKTNQKIPQKNQGSNNLNFNQNTYQVTSLRSNRFNNNFNSTRNKTYNSLFSNRSTFNNSKSTSINNKLNKNFKRGATANNFPKNKLNKLTTGNNFNSNYRPKSANTKYCPRIHSSTIIKKVSIYTHIF